MSSLSNLLLLRLLKAQRQHKKDKHIGGFALIQHRFTSLLANDKRFMVACLCVPALLGLSMVVNEAHRVSPTSYTTQARGATPTAPSSTTTTTLGSGSNAPPPAVDAVRTFMDRYMQRTDETTWVANLTPLCTPEFASTLPNLWDQVNASIGNDFSSVPHVLQGQPSGTMDDPTHGTLQMDTDTVPWTVHVELVNGQWLIDGMDYP